MIALYDLRCFTVRRPARLYCCGGMHIHTAVGCVAKACVVYTKNNNTAVGLRDTIHHAHAQQQARVLLITTTKSASIRSRSFA